MITDTCDIEQRRLILVILGHLLAVYPPKKQKIQNFEKEKKIAGGIIILHMCTKTHNNMTYGS